MSLFIDDEEEFGALGRLLMKTCITKNNYD